MAYRDDSDAFAQQRAQDDAEAALALEFLEAERVRRTRAYTRGIGAAIAAIVVMVAVSAWPSDSPRFVSAEVEPIIAPRDVVAEHVAAERRACLRWALHVYLKNRNTLQSNVAGEMGPQRPQISLHEIAERCASLPPATAQAEVRWQALE